MRAPMGSVSVRGPDDVQILLHAFPNDQRFARDIQRAALAVGTTAADQAEFRDLLQHALRAWYPRLEVRARDKMAAVSGDPMIWYVLRDGRVAPPRERLDRMHAALSDARATSADSERALERAEAVLAIARAPRTHGRERRAPERSAPAPAESRSEPSAE